jgi:hypothetical protein
MIYFYPTRDEGPREHKKTCAGVPSPVVEVAKNTASTNFRVSVIICVLPK